MKKILIIIFAAMVMLLLCSCSEEPSSEQPENQETFNIISEYDGGFGYTIFRIEEENLNCGIKRGDEIIIQPVYNSAWVPFEDRFLLYEGAAANQGFGLGLCVLTDSKGNELCRKFSQINYYLFDDGSYIGVAACADYQEVPCFDENGEPMPAGFWFVDKDGKLLSERFLFSTYDEIPLINSPEDVISATDERGNNTEISVSDYVCK